MRLPPLKSLQVFLSAAKHESFKVAANQLHVTQAAVSQQIRALESHFGEPLFERYNKKTTLNSRGKLLLPYIEEAFAQIQLGVSALSHSPESKELKITALHSITSLLLIPNINQFQQENSDLNVQFSPNNNLDSFSDKNIDIGIRRGLGRYAGLESRKLIDDSIVLVACPIIARDLGDDLSSIMSLALLEDTSSDIQEAIAHFCSKFNYKKSDFTINLRTTDSLPLINGTLAGQGMTFVSRVLVEPYLRTGQLVKLLDYEFDSTRTLYLVAPAQHFKWDKVQRLEKWLKKLFTPD